jgi:hypothetical protein
LETVLGLSAASLARLHWTIQPTEEASVVPLAERPRRRLSVAEEGTEE